MENRFLDLINNLNVSKYAFLGVIAIFIAFACVYAFLIVKLQLWLSENRVGCLLLPILSVLITCTLVGIYVTNVCVNDLIIIGYCIMMLSSLITIILSLMVLTNKKK